MIDPNSQRNPGAGPDAAPKEFRLGVLLVHGIGTQPPRDTLVRWGDALLKLIGQATKNEVIPTVGRGSPGDRSGDNPAEAAVQFRADGAVQFRADGREEKWLLAECWWADCFPAPTYSELVSWSVRAVPWAIALHIAERYWQADPQAPGKAKLPGWVGARYRLVCAVIQLLVAMALTPVFIAVLAVMLLLGLLPIPQLRSLILSAQSTLTGTVGDSLAFVESPLRAALVRTRILEGLERLQARCERTVIVAHSQGAAAVRETLGGITEVPDQGDAIPQPPKRPVPDTLVTFGSGSKKIASLRFLSTGPLKKTFGGNPTSVAMVTLLVMIGTLLFLYVGIRSGSITVWRLGEAAALYTVVICSTVFLGWGAVRLIDKLRASGALAARKEAADKNLELWVCVIVTTAAILFLFIYASKHDLPLYPVICLSMALLLLGASLVLILSDNMKEAMTDPVREPPGLRRWVDLYASADPVPNGETRIAEAKPTQAKPAEPKSADVECVRVWNRGSILSDHTTYWDNLDGFVLRLARECAETAESPWQNKLPPPTCWEWADPRAAWRVGFLRCAVRLNTLFWLFAFVLLWTRHSSHVPLLFELPWFPAWAPTAERFAVLAAVVAVAWWATAALMRWPWSLWVRAEQELVLAHKNPADAPTIALGGMVMVINLLLVLAWALAFGYESRASELLADPGDLVVPLILIVPGGLFLAQMTVMRWPGPQPPATPASHSAKAE